MKIIVDNETNVLVYPGLPDNLIHIDNPQDRAMVLIDLKSVDKLIEALIEAKQLLEERK
ncbi:hypothetical protein MVUOKPPV_CDS0304 [Klebsiella phage phi1_175008]|uniref:Uncharacterized protein n=2 Tax=Klebsiella phage phi1_175008 TaxID=3127744 RepID=A0ACD5FS28_9CAUD